MKLVSQPDRSYSCGQCCVTMVSGTSLKIAISSMGSKGCTTAKKIAKALKDSGIECGTRLIPIYNKFDNLPEFCIVKVKLSWKKYGFHWVVKLKDEIYDPGLYGKIPLTRYLMLKDLTISSYLRIETP